MLNKFTKEFLPLPLISHFIRTKRIKTPFSAFCYDSARGRLLLKKKKKIVQFCKNQVIILQKINLQLKTFYQEYTGLKMTTEQHITWTLSRSFSKTRCLVDKYQKETRTTTS